MRITGTALHQATIAVAMKHYTEHPLARFFLYGEGGALSRWAEPCGTSGHQWGSDVLILDESEARMWLEQHDFVEKLEELFGAEIVEG